MKKVIKVEGMTCNHCVHHVKTALEELNGVTSASVDLATKTAVIESNAAIENKDIEFAVDDAGYKVTSIEEA